MADIPQVSFSSGELAPSLYGRIDFTRYYTGLKTCRNFIVRPMGGVANRPPFLAWADAENAVRIWEFQVSSDIGYVLEFSAGRIRVLRDGTVYANITTYTDTEDATQVIPYNTAEIIWMLKFVQNNDVLTITHKDYPAIQLKHYAFDDWRLEEYRYTDGAFLDVNIDKTVTVIASDYVGDITITANSDIFAATDVGRLFYIESMPNGTIPVWETSKSVTIGDVYKAGSNYYKALNSETTGTVMPTTTEGSEMDGTAAVMWSYLHSGYGVCKITGYVSAKEVTATVETGYTLPTDLTAGSNEPITIYTDDGSHLDGTVTPGGFPVPDYVYIQGIAGLNPDVLYYVAPNGYDGVRVYTQDRPDVYPSTGTFNRTTGGASYKWAFDAWGGDQGYPATSSFSQQRQVFGGSTGQPWTFWMSTVGGYNSFKQNMPIQDDDRITFKVSSRDRNEIRHFVELGELVMLTDTGEWIITGGQDGVITPSTTSIKRQGFSGSSQVQPLVIDSFALFIQEKGSQIKTLGYSFQEDAFIGKDLTILSSHLFLGHTIVDWAYQKNPFSAVWCVRDDGVLLCLTYAPEHEVIGWSRHDTTGGLIKSVCCLSENGADVLYLLIDRNGMRYIEKMDVRYPNTSTTAWMDRGNIPYVQEIETLEVNAPSSNLRDKQKLIPHVTILCEEGYNLLVGSDSDNLFPVSTKQQYTHGTVDVRVSTTWNKGGNVVIRNNGTEACTILGVIPEVQTGGS